MTAAEISQYLGLVLAALALLGHAKGYFSSGEKSVLERVGSVQDRVEKAEGTLITHDRRIQTIEGEMRHMPDKDTVHRLQVDMTEMKGQMTSIVKTSEATERATRRVEEFLISRKD